VTLTVKDWRDSPDSTTPLSATALEDLETRMGAYADTAATAQPIWRPSYNNLLIATSPVTSIDAIPSPTAGVLLVTRIYVPTAVTLATMNYIVATAGSGAQLPVNVFIGVYSRTGTLLGKTAAQDTPVQSTGNKTAALTAEAGQSLAITGGANEYVWGAVLIGTQSTVAVVLRGVGGGSALTLNAGLSASSPFYSGSIGTGQTALPASFTTTSLTPAAGYWFGIS
jgi:hypothetical protein